MTADDILPYYEQYLEQLRTELLAYPTEQSLWLQPAGIHNTAGNLAAHLLGNLNHFIGTALGHTGYVRDRIAEFADKNISRQVLLTSVADTQAMVVHTIRGIADFQANYPTSFREDPSTVGGQLHRLLAHLAYHVGQINYHRRLLTTEPG